RIGLKYDVAFKNTVLATYHLDSENRSVAAPTEYNKTFMSIAEEILEEQGKSENISIYFREYMISRILPKIRYLIDTNQNEEARRILWKYRDTTYNKKALLKTYLMSFKLINRMRRISKRK